MPARRTQSARKSHRFAGAGRVRSAAGRPSSYDPKTRTFEAVLATENACRTHREHRGMLVEVDEVLPMAGLTGLKQFIGAAILDTHNSGRATDQIGVVEDAWIDGSSLVFRGRLSARAGVDDIAADMESGVIRSFSVGFDIVTDGVPQTRKGQRPLVTVKKWRPLEASIAAVPADQAARIRSRNGTAPIRIQRRRTRMADITVETEDQIYDHVVEILEDVVGDDDTVDIEELANEIVDQVVEDVEADDAEGGEGEDGARKRRRGSRRTSRTSTRSGRRTTRSARSERGGGKGDEAKLRSLRAIAKRNGTSSDFRDLEASGASLSELRQAALASLRTGASEINGERSSARGGRGAGGLVTFDDTPAGKRAAARRSK